MCGCYHCTTIEVYHNPLPSDQLTFGDPRFNRMFLCETCGNKRCPHAADHRNACTGSNEPGQPGSLYESVPVFRDRGSKPDRAETVQQGSVHESPGAAEQQSRK